jgi:hypothetical protein
MAGAAPLRQLHHAKSWVTQFRIRGRANQRHAQPFEAVCAELQLSIGLGDRVTELVGRKIIELAMAGERDAARRPVATMEQRSA